MQPDRRAQLQGWIAETQRNLRRYAMLCGALGLIAIAVGVGWRASVGKVAFGCVVLTALVGFWVMGAHLADWRHKLRELGVRERQSGSG